jgi:hypothetical protein
MVLMAWWLVTTIDKGSGGGTFFYLFENVCRL